MTSSLPRDSSFLGGRIPAEIDLLSKQLKDVDHELFRKILRAVVVALEGGDAKPLLQALMQDSPFPEERLAQLLSGVHSLLSAALRHPPSSLRQEAFKEDLRELRIPEEFVSDFSSVVFGNRRPGLDSSSSQQAPCLPSLQEFRWRVDVAISTSCLGRALQPSVLMQMKTSDGKVQRFEVSVSRFQELRYNVALILKEMNDLEKRSVLHIQD